MAITRTLYSTQQLNLTVPGATHSPIKLPVQSASIDMTVPTENVLVLGKLGALGRQQKTYNTVKMSVKFYLTSGMLDANQFTANHLDKLTGNALSGTVSVLELSNGGFTGQGILSNFSIDSTVGDFVSATLSFDGIGTPASMGSSGASNASNNVYTPTGVTVFTSESVFLGSSAGAVGDTIKSAKFSIDIPGETLGRLGSKVTGYQTVLMGASNDYLHVAKPPFKTSFSYDGEFVGGEGYPTGILTFGNLKITPAAASTKLTSQKFDQKAGDIGATISFTSEGTDCAFAAYP